MQNNNVSYDNLKLKSVIVTVIMTIVTMIIRVDNVLIKSMEFHSLSITTHQLPIKGHFRSKLLLTIHWIWVRSKSQTKSEISDFNRKYYRNFIFQMSLAEINCK